MPIQNRPVYVILEMEMVRQGFKRSSLAEKLGISKPTLSKLLNGKKDWPLSLCYRTLKLLMLDNAMLPEVFPPKMLGGE